MNINKDIERLTPDDKLAVCDELREVHYLETYLDMAGMCKKLAISVDFILKHNNAPMDNVEKNSLETLRELLPLCAHLFIQSDDYYRE